MKPQMMSKTVEPDWEVVTVKPGDPYTKSDHIRKPAGRNVRIGNDTESGGSSRKSYHMAMPVRLVLAIAALVLMPVALVRSEAQPLLPTCASPTLATFDVATIKPDQIDSRGTQLGGTVDSLNATGTAIHMIEFAYKLHDFQVSGGPGWVTNEAWEVTAKVDQPPANYGSLSNDAGDEIQRERLQAVLAQRFNLKCHFEAKQLPVYNLVLAKGGVKLRPTSAGSKDIGSLGSDRHDGANRVYGTGISLQFITAILSGRVGRLVIDKTGLTGIYDFTVTYATDSDAASSVSASEPSGPTIFTAVEEQLGLKLEPAKGPVPVLVIDSIIRPSEN